MRLLILVLLFVISSSVTFAACPDLRSETKVCRSAAGQFPGNHQQMITQLTQEGVTTYHIEYKKIGSDETITKVLFADGKARREIEVDPDTGISLLTATTMSCADNTLLGHTTAFIDGQFLGIMDSKTTKLNSKIITVIEGTLYGRDVNDTLICE